MALVRPRAFSAQGLLARIAVNVQRLIVFGTASRDVVFQFLECNDEIFEIKPSESTWSRADDEVVMPTSV